MIELEIEHFNQSIMIHSKIWNKGKEGFSKCDMVFDTGASMTAIDTRVAMRAGYSLKNAKEVVVNGIGKSNIPAKRLTLINLELGGIELGPVLIDVLDFPEDSNVSAVLGMNVIKHFRMTADFDEKGPDGRNGTIWLQPKFDITEKPNIENFNTDSSRFSDWWASSDSI